MALGSLISGLLGSAGKIFDEMHTSKEENDASRAKFMLIQGDILTKVAKFETELVDTQAAVIKAEARSKSWAARNWRPILMLTFTYIIAHNYVLAPSFGLNSLEIPPDMWGLLKIGIGGYIGGRTLEAITPDIIKLVRR